MANNTNGLTALKRFFNLLKVDKQEIASIYIFALFSGIVSLSLPLGIQAIINLISGGQTSTSWVLLVVLVVIGVGFGGVLQIYQLAITENLQQKIFTRSAFEFAYRIPRLKLEELGDRYTPEIVNRFFDTLTIQKGLPKILLDFSGATLQALFGLILLSLYHPFFIMFSLVLTLIFYFIFRYTVPQGVASSYEESNYKYKVAHWLEEMARALETFKLAGKSEMPMKETDELVVKYLGARKRHFRTLLIQYVNTVLFKVLIVSGLLIIGGLLVINEQMNIGQFVASEIIIILVLGSLEKVMNSMETIYDVLTAVEKLGSVTDIPLERNKGVKMENSDKPAFGIKLNSVSYQFPNAKLPILNNVSFEIKAGEKVCLSGENGAGKSILLQVMSGLYDNFSGTIIYEDIPIGNWCKEDFHVHLGDNLVKEDIFRGTLLQNITIGVPGISMEKIQRIARVVGLNEFVETLTEGYDTMLVPEGKNLPKSVRLKIMLARAIVGEPKVIFLEDNFNNLNLEDRERFLDYVLAGKWTVIATSNHTYTAERFDRCLVVEKGQIKADAPLKSLEKEEWFDNVFNKK